MEPHPGLRPKATFRKLRGRIRKALSRYGREDTKRPYEPQGDFDILDMLLVDGSHRVAVHNLQLSGPEVVCTLQQILTEFPGWGIHMTVPTDDGINVPPLITDGMPPMGIVVFADSVVGGLRRQCFPPECRNIAYPDGRPEQPHGGFGLGPWQDAEESEVRRDNTRPQPGL